MSETNSVTVEHVLSASEERALNRAIHRAQRLRIPMLAFGLVCTAGAAIAMIGGTQAGTLLEGATAALPWALLGGAWVTFAMVPFSFWSAHARVRGPHVRTLDEAGLHIRAGTVAVDLPWNSMARTVETSEFFLFFDAMTRPYYLPKAHMKEREVRDAQRLVASRSPETVRRLRG